MLSCGDTFLIPKSKNEVEHLWVVVTEPGEDGRAVCVNISTRQEYSDSTVVLKPGEHPYIKHDSIVYYTDAQVLDLNSVEAALNAKTRSFVCQDHESCSEALLKRIQKGLIDSPHTPKGIKKDCRILWGVKS